MSRKAEHIRAASKPEHWPPPEAAEVAVAGRSNVGKSSFINCLTRTPGIARVSKTPGRTQALHFFRTGLGFTLVDLPGYGYARVPMEVKKAWWPMIEGYLKGRAELDAVVCLVDIRHEPTEQDGDLVSFLEAIGKPPLVVATKADKLSANQRAKALKAIREALNLRWPPVAMSSQSGEGRDAVLREIREILALRQKSRT